MMKNFLKRKKGQVTVETLLIFLISLTVIMIAFTTVSILDKTQRRVAYNSILSMQADQIEEFVNQACVLGDGNYYTIKTATISFKMSQKDKKSITFKTSSASIIRTFLCDVVLEDEQDYKGYIFIWYEDDKVYLSAKPKSD